VPVPAPLGYGESVIRVTAIAAAGAYLRGMNKHSADFIAKLRQIEEQANSANAEIAPGLTRTRLQHIVLLARTLRGRLEFGPAAVVTASDVPETAAEFATAKA
jgi:hypothetical protein